MKAATLTALLFCSMLVFSQTGKDTLAVRMTVLNYYKGLEEKNAKLARTAFDDRLIFFNGNYSDEQKDWQTHMYLDGSRIDDWLRFMISEAGLHENSLEFKHIHIRGRSALVVTEETGKNKFRSWNKEKVVWNMGYRKGAWRIVSVFIKDSSNP